MPKSHALLCSRVAVWMFALSLMAIFIMNFYDLAAETSRMLVSGGALIMTGVIVAIAILELAYAWTMEKRGTSCGQRPTDCLDQGSFPIQRQKQYDAMLRRQGVEIRHVPLNVGDDMSSGSVAGQAFITHG